MRILGLEVVPGEVRVARGVRTIGAARLLGVERHAVADEAALAAVLRRLAAERPHAVLTALPLAAAAHRLLALPFRDRRRLLHAAPLELLAQLPVDVEDGRVACAVAGAPADGRVLAAVVRGADIDALAARLRGGGLAPERIELAPLPVLALLPDDTDAALVLADGPRSALVVRHGGRVAGLRALGACGRDVGALAAEVRWALRALDPTSKTIVVAGADAGGALAAALAAATGTRPIALAEAAARIDRLPPDTLAACAVAAGLVAGAGRTRVDRLGLACDRAAGRSLRRAGGLAAAAALLALVDVGLVRHALVRRDAALAEAIAVEAAAALPGVRIVAPREQLAQAVEGLARSSAALGRTRALELLRDVSRRVPPSLRLDLDELALGVDGLLLRGRTDAYDAVEALRRALAGSPLLADVRAEETRPGVDGRRVEFRLRATPRPPGGVPS